MRCQRRLNSSIAILIKAVKKSIGDRHGFSILVQLRIAIIAKTIRFPETTVVGEPITTYATSSGGAA